MPHGVKNAPSTFQRLMERCIGDLHLNEALLFVDDLIVSSDTLDEHEARLMKVYKRESFTLLLSPNAPLGEEWTPECESTFRALIEKLTAAPILAFANANSQVPYVLHNNA